MGALEFDPLLLCIFPSIIKGRPLPYSVPVSTVNISIALFASIFPLQSVQYQEVLLDQIHKQSTSTKFSNERKVAIQYNTIVSLIGALNSIIDKKLKLIPGRVVTLAQDLAMVNKNSVLRFCDISNLMNENFSQSLLNSPSGFFRHFSAMTLGLLARAVSTNTFTGDIIKRMIDQIVNDRDPTSRSGCLLALGYIFRYVGGLNASLHLQQVLSVLQTLVNDTHPIVHTSAAFSLHFLVDSAGPNFSHQVKNILSLIVKSYMKDSHQSWNEVEEMPPLDRSMPSFVASLGRIVFALMGILGPELAINKYVSDMCYNMYQTLISEDDPSVTVEAVRIIQQFLILSQLDVDVPYLIPKLQRMMLPHSKFSLRKAALTCLWQVMPQHGQVVMKHACNLEEQLFALYDGSRLSEEITEKIKEILFTMIRLTPSLLVTNRLAICRKMLSRTGIVEDIGAVLEQNTSNITSPTSPTFTSSTPGGNDNLDQNGEGEADLEDDTDEIRTGTSKAPIEGIPFDSSTLSETSDLLAVNLKNPRWQTQLFALSLVRQILDVAKENVEHIDLKIARELKENSRSGMDLLVFRLADLIRVAFNAATSGVDEFGVEGLRLLQQILQIYSGTEDPDYEEHALLEQYQAQISAALTPAFAADSSPEFHVVACRVCATYISSGISQELNTLGRVLKLLTTLLDKCKLSSLSHQLSVSPHASAAVRVSIVTGKVFISIQPVLCYYLFSVFLNYLK